jgi:hypothetical protein
MSLLTPVSWLIIAANDRKHQSAREHADKDPVRRIAGPLKCGRPPAATG